jgi:hypothetical protein
LKIAAKFGGYGLTALYSGGLCLLGGLGLAQNFIKIAVMYLARRKKWQSLLVGYWPVLLHVVSLSRIKQLV